MCQSGWNSKHFQGKCAESVLSVDAGASLLRSTMRRTKQKGTSIARSSRMMTAQGWGGSETISLNPRKYGTEKSYQVEWSGGSNIKDSGSLMIRGTHLEP